MINHVINQQQFSVIDDVHESYHPFKNDSYFKKCSQLKSVLCLPFHSQSKLTGVIYLENNLTIGAFDDRRVEMLQMMAAQAAISIENASLYENLEEKVIDRTRQLKAAQAKLVTRAHESGMAEMAIGVLHNIGNAITPANTKTDLLLKELREDPIPNLLDQSMSELATIVAESNAEASIKERYAQFLKLLPENIHQTNDERISKLGSISERHQHIIGIVQTQMKYAKTMSMHDIMDINQVVEDAVEMQRDLLEKYSVELTTNYAQLPMVEIEQVKIVQIIVNLIKNAYEAMSETPSEHRKLMILTELTTDKNFVSVMIKDNGIGFDPADKAKLFNFGYSTKQRGTGFGLHACGNYMLAQNGHITADSNGIDKGATFTVIIPIKCKHK